MNNYRRVLFFIFFFIGINEGLYSQVEKMDSMTFYKDYFPGTNDSNGKYLGSTETMSIVEHKGRLYAGMGNWMDYPITIQSEGTQVLRKDSHNSPWVVDTTIGFTSLRCDGFKSVSFTKDYNGNVLAAPLNLLVGGFTRTIPPYHTSIWVKKDHTDQWYRNKAGIHSSTAGLTGIRSFHTYTDKVTGKEWLFCGTASGAIIKAAYHPAKIGLLEIDTLPEISGLGRVMSITSCDNYLYASTGVELITGDTVGGLYKRVDGINPTWELVYQWAYDSSINDNQNVLRGITCVPDPFGSSNNVLIGARNKGGVIQVIQPFNNDNVYTELDVTQYFADLWFNGNWTYMDYALIAYNDFMPDTIQGEKVWWISLAIHAPNQLVQPTNGAYYLLRYEDGTYQWGYIYDENSPVPNGESLRATRTICKSPFTEDSNKVYYFGGYDCLADTSNNTAWIYKGILHDFTAEVDEFQNPFGELSLYPNPSDDFVVVEPVPSGAKLSIRNISGELIRDVKAMEQESVIISTEGLANGIYFLTIEKNGKAVKKKLLINR